MRAPILTRSSSIRPASRLRWSSGRGVWMMHQLCDLVEMRAPPSGLIVRMHLALD
ncbi:hypothetical protein [Streptomyces sp. WELS2]|uniref:hypothetical protein n=1 Tax=Streptomyces sp. WELS2 TaxID=2749435 RepID=UPI0015F01814|nr:hypothetical protein [Streptomyces sp. WELS2]